MAEMKSHMVEIGRTWQNLSEQGCYTWLGTAEVGSWKHVGKLEACGAVGMQFVP